MLSTSARQCSLIVLQKSVATAMMHGAVKFLFGMMYGVLQLSNRLIWQVSAKSFTCYFCYIVFYSNEWLHISSAHLTSQTIAISIRDSNHVSLHHFLRNKQTKIACKDMCVF